MLQSLMYNHRFLDISFNHISDIEHLDGLLELKKLFLIQNKISMIKNLHHLINLTTLELGSNKIRVTLDAIVSGHNFHFT